MLKRIALLCLFLVAFAPTIGATEDEAVLLKKSQLLVQKAQRYEQKGEIEDAVAFYEEAYNTYPKNILPLMLWGKTLVKVGMYDRASELLGQIPIEKLPPAGQSEVHLLMGRIAIARGSVEDAASAYSRSLKASEKNDVARVRLAMVNQLLGMSSRADELLRDYDNFAGLAMPELRLALMIDLELANFGRAMYTSAEMSRLLSRSGGEEGGGVLSGILCTAPAIFITCLPLGLSYVLCALYFAVLFAGLLLLATRLTAPSAVWQNVLFVVLGVVSVVTAQVFMKHDFYVAILQDDFSLFDSLWIIPRMLVGGHFVAIALFAVFPAFLLLPAAQKPKRHELFGIWFFCWFFMAFVLVFQSRIAFGSRMTLMAVTFLLSAFTSFFMPLGRFVIFKITSLLGYGEFASVSHQDLRASGGISFTDAKILETKAWKLIDKDEYGEAIMAARKVLGSYDRQTFPMLWKAYIFALIAGEDYLEAQQQLAEFLEVFKKHNAFESGQLYEAFLKVRKGDFGGALKIIRGLPEHRVKSFSPDENALSLLILGRCALSCGENVQAHIELVKAFNSARMPLIKAEALTEVAELDFNLKSKDALAKLKDKLSSISGGALVASYKDVILSILAQSDNQPAEALKLAEKASSGKIRNSRAFAWYGHLLCLAGEFSRAEELLTKMAPDSQDASRLMSEVTSSS
ncbi:MAG: hypothetical protein CVV42_04420 [Candidatus Riflebacteria bacterium HGW-Riflebacteria-2]|nr:MAG: hypothetical protein CVV42_04420 [Candidatus Riflebacteria bacterium HGW-Riflebacteria-2]